MEKKYYFLFFSILLPFICGCQGAGGGGGGSGVSGASFSDPSFSFVSGSSSGGSGGSGSGNSGGGGDSIAQLHNPEPLSMLLMGGGLMAMGLHRRKKQLK